MAKIKILIVEDNPIVAEDLKRKLINLNYEVTATTYSGNEALESVKEKLPDIVLMDIRLGDGMNGIDVATILKKDHNLSVIYVTAHSDDDTIFRAKQTQPYGYIVKPFDDNELKSTVEIAVYKQQADRQIIESKQWFQTTLNSIGDGVIATDEKGNITFMNPIAVQLTGWNENEAVGKPIEEVFNIINEETRKKVENPVNKVLKEDKVIGLANHTLLISRDGSEIPIKDSGAPIKLSNSENLGVVLVFQDDSKNKKAQERLKKSHEIIKQKSIILAASNKLFGKTINCKSSIEVAQVCLTIAEEVTKSQFGSIAEVNKNNRFDTLALSNPGWDQCKIAELDPSSIQDMEMRGLWVAALKSKHGLIFNAPSNSPLSVGVPEGHPPLTSFLGVPFKHKNFNGMIGIANRNGGYTEKDREIIEALVLAFGEVINTKRAEEAMKRSEFKYRSMMESMSDPVYICSPDFTITYMNPAMIKRTGKDATGGTCFNYLHKTDKQCDWCVFDRVASGETIETTIVSPMDNRHYRVNNMPIMNEDGTVSKMTIMRDITEYIEAVKQKEKSASQLLQAQKMESIGNLAGGIAHDFNNILTLIIGFSQLAIGEVKKGSTIEDDLQEIHEAGIRAKNLVKQILTFARRSEDEIMPVRPSIIVKEVLKFIRSSIPTTIEIKHNINSNTFIMGNATQMHQIFMNLCTNAAHSMEDNGGVLEINLSDISLDDSDIEKKIHLRPGDYIKIEVSDTGIGIPPDVMDSVFEPYFTTKKPGEGTGMGLAVVQGIVESYEGIITVDSKQNEGTTVTILLPKAEKNPYEKAEKAEEIPTGTERILFVDDEITIIKLGKRMIEQLGYSVITENSSIEALSIFKANPLDFDLVVSDMTMPDMTGDELAIEMLKIRPEIPIIMCTGYSKKISEKEAKKIGIKAFGFKPFVKLDLAKTIREVLDKANSST